MLPWAPALFSTMKGWPNAACNSAPVSRATWSVALPAGKGTMSLTGCDGHVWAWAAVAPINAKSRTNRILPLPLLSQPLGGIERRLGTARVAARLARLGDELPVPEAQGVVPARPGIGALRAALRLRVFLLLKAHARELLPQSRVARLDPEGPLERRRGVVDPPRSGIDAGAVHQARDRRGLGVGRGGGEGRRRTRLRGRNARAARNENGEQECQAGVHARIISSSPQALPPVFGLPLHILDGNTHRCRAGGEPGGCRAVDERQLERAVAARVGAQPARR